VIEVECSVPECICDVGDAVFPQDIEGETACPCHDAGVVTDATLVFVAGDVADVVVAVFDGPMSSDGVTPLGCCEVGGGREVVGDLAALIPQAGGGGSEQGVAGDADDGLDEGVPLGRDQGIADGKDFDGAVLLAGAAGVACKNGLGRADAVSNGADGVKQISLIGLQLDQEVIASVTGDFKCFFDSAWHPG
jgi:hypothetical protein